MDQKRTSYNMAILANNKNISFPKFQEYLLERKLVPEKNVPYFAHWVSRYLNFAREREIPSDVYHETGVLDFLEELRSDCKSADWQYRQADDAIRPFRKA